MRIPDTTLVVSAIFQLAQQHGEQNVSPGQVTSYLNSQYSLNMPLHAVSDIIISLGLTTHTVNKTRYIVWNKTRIESLKATYFPKIEANH